MPLYFTVHLTVAGGKLEAFEQVAQEMVALSEAEPGTLSYAFCFDAERTNCRLLESYLDSDAAVAHLTGPVVRDFVPKLLEASSLNAFEVYGDASPRVAEILGALGARFFGFELGFVQR